MHYHLDAVGGIAGDMFVAALLDLHPELAPVAIAAVRAAGLGESVGLTHQAHADGVLTGSRFVVDGPPVDEEWGHDQAQGHRHAHEHGQAHAHVHWAALRRRLEASALDAAVAERAIDVFGHLAVAEARVHGKAVEDVAFHEVGAWDSIADIVAASALLAALGTTSWSIGPIPLGSGRVRTAHGLLPVPAPATVLLLEGLACFDDGFAGERVTPTGAAIVRHLAPAQGLGPLPRRLRRSGHGFGTRRFEGLSNVLRILEFAPHHGQAGPRGDNVVVIRFEVDDQTGEDLALGLERLRDSAGVLDVSQLALTGKQGRLVAGVQVLARPDALDAVTDACFRETTTLGLRLSPTQRLVLPRHAYTGSDGSRAKLAYRPDAVTAKAELADLAAEPGHAARQARRTAVERAALADAAESDDER